MVKIFISCHGKTKRKQKTIAKVPKAGSTTYVMTTYAALARFFLKSFKVTFKFFVGRLGMRWRCKWWGTTQLRWAGGGDGGGGVGWDGGGDGGKQEEELQFCSSSSLLFHSYHTKVNYYLLPQSLNRNTRVTMAFVAVMKQLLEISLVEPSCQW